MDPIVIIYSLISAACLILGFIHGVTWLRLRKDSGDGALAITAIGTALFCVTDLVMLKAETIEAYGWGVRWLHVPAFIVMVGLLLFIKCHLHAGRTWLAWLVIAIRAVSLAVNFTVDFNLNYRELTAIHQRPFLGTLVTEAEGVSHPWMLIGQVSLLLLIAFTVDAAVTLWRRGESLANRVLILTIAFFIITGTVNAVLVLWEISQLPLTPSLFFTGTIIAMGFNLSTSVIQSIKNAEALRESSERMTLAAEAVNLGFWTWDTAGDRIESSGRWKSLFGFGPDEMPRYGDVMARIHPADRADIELRVRKAIDGQRMLTGDFRVILPDGTIRWISASGKMLNDEHGPARRFLGVAIDATEKKLAEMETQEQRSQIARLSRVSTLGELSGSLAHELNQPLTAILINTQAALRQMDSGEDTPAQIREILSDIEFEDRRAAEIIKRLRSLLQKGEVEKEETVIADVVNETARLIRPEVQSRDVSLDLQLDPATPPVLADRVQLQQVLLNLMVNGIAAMRQTPPDQRVLTVQAGPADESGVRISVSDRGTGIDSHVLERIFDPFVTTKPEGMGLGLKVCRTIVNAHGGRITAANNEGPGAVFTIVLP